MKYCFFILILLQATISFAGNVIFVNKSATGNHTGTDWANAFPDLQEALMIANNGDEIWVAQGVYLPTTSSDRNISFNLPAGVGLYGGFLGTETSKDERNPKMNVTTLSGDIGMPDLRIDNAFHVVTIYGGDQNTILDGFRIAYGYGDEAFSGFPNEFGGGLLVASDGNRPSATPVVTQCRFEYNRAGSGGAIACIGQDETICNPKISFCDFTFNRGEYYGGAVFKQGLGNPEQAFIISDCNFESNYCKHLGGGLTIFETADTLIISKCTFVKDTANEAGAVLLWSSSNFTHYKIDQCNIHDNYTPGAGPGIEHIFPGFSPTEKIELIVSRSNFSFNRNFVGIGGGISSFTLSDVGKLLIQVEDCGFSFNESQNGGAGILVSVGQKVYSEIKVDRCWFFGNITKASSVAAAFYYRAYGVVSNTNKNVITNSVFMFNDGAIASLGGKPGVTNTTIANCSFYDNGDIPFVKFWGPENNPVDLVMKMQILNSIIWEPQTEGIFRTFFNNNPANFTINDYLVEHSMIYLPSCSYNGFDPCGEGVIYDTWPEFVTPPEFTSHMNLQLCSPAQNRGSNLVADSLGLTLDYWRLPRVIADTVDIGAYEIQASCFTSGVFDPAIPMTLGARLLQNPTPSGQPVEVELFSAFSEWIAITVIDATGRLIYQNQVDLAGATPAKLSIPASLRPGEIYFLKISDGRGRYKTLSVVAI